MIGLTPPDRWTCPTCGRTVVPTGRDEAAVQRAIRQAQERHAARHSSALEIALRGLDKSNADRPG